MIVFRPWTLVDCVEECCELNWYFFFQTTLWLMLVSSIDCFWCWLHVINWLKYKKSFSKDGEVNFYIGTKVHNQNIYDDVCDRWTKKYSTVTNQHSQKLLKYREIKWKFMRWMAPPVFEALAEVQPLFAYNSQWYLAKTNLEYGPVDKHTN